MVPLPEIARDRPRGKPHRRWGGARTPGGGGHGRRLHGDATGQRARRGRPAAQGLAPVQPGRNQDPQSSDREYQGKTEKQKNPHPRGTLAWAAWCIARLGGWNGYAKERPPGPITFARGLQRFHAIAEGYKLATHRKRS